MEESETERIDRRFTADELVAEAYPVLCAIAGRALKAERAEHTLQPTAVAHEAYLRLRTYRKGFSGRSEFIAAAAVSIRRLLMDHARGKRAQRRSGAMIPLDAATLIGDSSPAATLDLLALEEAMTKLRGLNPTHELAATLMLFGGCSLEDAGEILEVGRATAHRYWTAARAFLRAELLS